MQSIKLAKCTLVYTQYMTRQGLQKITECNNLKETFLQTFLECINLTIFNSPASKLHIL